jgi:pimeloyl-ACP methyl ester carboxylesterase
VSDEDSLRPYRVNLGVPIHAVDFGGSGPAMVLVHGLGGSVENWFAVGPALARRARVVGLDLMGFGRTPPGPDGAEVEANQRLLDQFVASAVGGPAILVGNSMGGLIAMMEAARSPGRVAGLVLVSPAQPRVRGAPIDWPLLFAFVLYSIPVLCPRLWRRRVQRLGPAGLIDDLLRIVCVDPSRVDRDVRAAHVALAAERLARMPWAEPAFVTAARSLMRALARAPDWRAMVEAITAPTLVIHGARDRLVPLMASRELVRRRPDWQLEVLEDIGHVAQLEAAGSVVAIVERWLDREGAAARRAATRGA